MENENKETPEVKWYVAKSSFSPLPYRNALNKSGLEYFLPTRFVMQNIGGRRTRVEKPVVFNFIFIRGTVFEVKDFCKSQQGLFIVYRYKSLDESKSKLNPLLTISDKEMHMFSKTIGQYTSDVPFIKPTEVNLSKGDHVRILSGPFAGVEGVLISQKGKDGGKVLVSLSNIISVPTLDIKPEYLEILSFSKTNKHLYKKFETFMPKARRALRNYMDKSNDAKDMAILSTFQKRFASLQTHTINSRVKLLVGLLVCYTCMGMEIEKKDTEVQLCDLLPQISSEQFKAFALTYLYACTKLKSYQIEAQEIIDAWGVPAEKEKTKREIIEDLAYYGS